MAARFLLSTMAGGLQVGIGLCRVGLSSINGRPTEKKGSADKSGLPFFMRGELPAENIPRRDTHFWVVGTNKIAFAAVGAH